MVDQSAPVDPVRFILEVDPVRFILEQEGAVTLPTLEPVQCFEILQGVVKRVGPQLKSLSPDTFKDLWDWDQEGAGVDAGMLDLPPQLTPETECALIVAEHLDRRGSVRFILINISTGELFFWEVMREENPSCRIMELSQEVFLQEWRNSPQEVLRQFIDQLRSQVNSAIEELQNAVSECLDADGWLLRIKQHLH